VTAMPLVSTDKLVARGLRKSFGGLDAVAGMDLQLMAGQITGLIGPNGAGKTTLLNLLSGFERPSAGSVALDSCDVTGKAPHELARLGLVRTFQICRDLGRLTVLENMLLARPAQSGETIVSALFRRARVRQEEMTGIARAEEVLRRVDLWRLADEPAASLSGGQKKLLELARALMAEPSIILLDEPAAGVAPAMEQVLIAVIRELVREGLTFLVVEHDLDVVAALCQRVYVMSAGQLLTVGRYEEVTSDPRVLEAYLGARAP
jgi:ABC-type branched-subunit amino acid transport system ATPase component